MAKIALETAKTVSLEDAYRMKFAGSAGLYTEALDAFPSGVTHDARYLEPFPIYVERAEGGHKWDVDGNELVDFWGGHGALLFGHAHPALVDAAHEQIGRGTHYGACHELEIRWAQLVKQLVPCAERVKFHSSGTEATLMAIRLARAVTGKKRVIKFEGHFHGWHDAVTAAVFTPFERPSSVGVPEETLDTVLALPSNDLEAVRKTLEGRDDVACLILEPSGGMWGRAPGDPEFLHGLRELTTRAGVVLIFDEVVSGFRLSPGGAQQFYGVTPDLTTLAKVLAGGLPGGAVCGKARYFEPLMFGPDPVRNRNERIGHPGTFNANPLSAAVGIACLELCASGDPQRRVNALGRELRRGLNEVLGRKGIPGIAYGHCSGVHILLGYECEVRQDEDHVVPDLPPEVLMGGGHRSGELRLAMLLEGVDLSRTSAMLMASHTDADLEHTVAAFETSLERLAATGPMRG